MSNRLCTGVIVWRGRIFRAYELVPQKGGGEVFETRPRLRRDRMKAGSSFNDIRYHVADWITCFSQSRVSHEFLAAIAHEPENQTTDITSLGHGDKHLARSTHAS